MAAPLFEIRELAKVYRMGEVEVHALHDVNLTLNEGEFVVLLGPSGSGKSTLLNIIGGLDVPTSGQVFYREMELTRADDDALTAYRRRNVGFVFQFYNLIPSLTAAENVALVTEISGASDVPRGGAAARQSRTARHALSRHSSRAANSSGSRSLARSRSGRPFCCATSRPARWTSPRASSCSRRWRR